MQDKKFRFEGDDHLVVYGIEEEGGNIGEKAIYIYENNLPEGSKKERVYGLLKLEHPIIICRGRFAGRIGFLLSINDKYFNLDEKPGIISKSNCHITADYIAGFSRKLGQLYYRHPDHYDDPISKLGYGEDLMTIEQAEEKFGFPFICRMCKVLDNGKIDVIHSNIVLGKDSKGNYVMFQQGGHGSTMFVGNFDKPLKWHINDKGVSDLFFGPIIGDGSSVALGY